LRKTGKRGEQENGPRTESNAPKRLALPNRGKKGETWEPCHETQNELRNGRLNLQTKKPSAFIVGRSGGSKGDEKIC